jgi:hypothetical protein
MEENMAKKMILVLVIFALLGGALFSQETEAAKWRPNTIALHASLIGAAFNYERAFTPHLSLLADTSVNVLGFAFTAAIKGRWYPFAGAFYVEMGVGYGRAVGLFGMVAEFTTVFLTLGFFDIPGGMLLNGVVFTPAIGWKIALGRGGLVLPIGLGIDLFYGKRNGIDIPVDLVPNIRIGLGYSF